MRTFLFAASAIPTLLAGLPTQAADMPAKTPMSKPLVAYNWTGAYVGGHLGAGWTVEESRVVQPGTPFDAGSGAAPGFLGGAQIGANYQVGAVVYGLEADVSWADLSGETCHSIGVGGVSCTSKADRIGTVAGKLGIAADRALFYFKAGAAWVHGTHGFQISTLPTAEASAGNSKWGWTAGAGVEYALTRNWSVKLEYDFMDFGTHRVDFDFAALGAVVSTDIKQSIHTLKSGLNYKFDWSGVVAANY